MNQIQNYLNFFVGNFPYNKPKFDRRLLRQPVYRFVMLINKNCFVQTSLEGRDSNRIKN